MRLSQDRLNESVTLISKHLVREHDDGDVNSLYVRFFEIVHAYEDVVDINKNWEMASELIVQSELSKNKTQ